MPILKIETNLPQGNISEAFLKKVSSLVAKWTSKPESYVSIVAQGGLAMTFAGTTEPCAQLVLTSIGGYGSNTNKIAAELSDVLEEDLKIPKNRFYINFVAPQASAVAFQGQTFG
ncbi:macrophage migration inhibitory factor-1 [Aphelenchoides avenae]|nr:macrophage migration inhibitory factor-1 [Aphelenchus avenae]KAH7728479.1 macrophage migration inhibitory factor-1 [Aphelenchus avenae]